MMNKYNARKTTVCGHMFDSKREAEIYLSGGAMMVEEADTFLLRPDDVLS